jgi:hypothetical protein
MKPDQPPPAQSWPLLIYALAAGAHFGLRADCSFEILDSAENESRRPGLSYDHFPGLLAETWGKVKAGVFRPEGENCDYCLLSRLCPRMDGEAAREEPA